MVILYKTWLVSVSFSLDTDTFSFYRMYQIQFKMHLNATNKTVEEVLILLTESGFVYISVWVSSPQLITLLER